MLLKIIITTLCSADETHSSPWLNWLYWFSSFHIPSSVCSSLPPRLPSCVCSYLLVTNRITVQSLGNISGRIRILKTVKIWRRKSWNKQSRRNSGNCTSSLRGAEKSSTLVDDIYSSCVVCEDLLWICVGLLCLHTKPDVFRNKEFGVKWHKIKINNIIIQL